MKELNKNISLNINILMKLKGKYKTTFCEIYNYNKRTVGKMIDNSICWDIDTLCDIALYLETPLEKIIFPTNREYISAENASEVSEPENKYNSLLDKIESLSRELGMKDFELNLKNIEIEKLKNKKSDK